MSVEAEHEGQLEFNDSLLAWASDLQAYWWSRQKRYIAFHYFLTVTALALASAIPVLVLSDLGDVATAAVGATVAVLQGLRGIYATDATISGYSTSRQMVEDAVQDYLSSFEESTEGATKLLARLREAQANTKRGFLSRLSTR